MKASGEPAGVLVAKGGCPAVPRRLLVTKPGRDGLVGEDVGQLLRLPADHVQQLLAQLACSCFVLDLLAADALVPLPGSALVVLFQGG
jgi:hypothetical protein